MVLVPQVAFIDVTLKASRYRGEELWGGRGRAGIGKKEGGQDQRSNYKFL